MIESLYPWIYCVFTLMCFHVFTGFVDVCLHHFAIGVRGTCRCSHEKATVPEHSQSRYHIL